MNIKTLRNAIFGALVAAPLVVGAQTKAPAPAPAQAPAQAPSAPAPAPLPPITLEQRVAIKDLLEAMNTRDALTKAYGAVSQGLAPRMADAMNRQIETMPTLSADQKQKVRENIGPSFDAAVKQAATIVTDPKLVDETMDKMIPIYAKYFTLPEVKQLTAFYRTPIGIKTLTTKAQADGESFQAGAAIFTPRITALMEKTLKTQVDAVTAAGPAPAPAAPVKK
jgi:hypothetical protein